MGLRLHLHLKNKNEFPCSLSRASLRRRGSAQAVRGAAPITWRESVLSSSLRRRSPLLFLELRRRGPEIKALCLDTMWRVGRAAANCGPRAPSAARTGYYTAWVQITRLTAKLTVSSRRCRYLLPCQHLADALNYKELQRRSAMLKSNAWHR